LLAIGNSLGVGGVALARAITLSLSVERVKRFAVGIIETAGACADRLVPFERSEASSREISKGWAEARAMRFVDYLKWVFASDRVWVTGASACTVVEFEMFCASCFERI